MPAWAGGDSTAKQRQPQHQQCQPDSVRERELSGTDRRWVRFTADPGHRFRRLQRRHGVGRQRGRRIWFEPARSFGPEALVHPQQNPSGATSTEGRHALTPRRRAEPAWCRRPVRSWPFVQNWSASALGVEVDAHDLQGCGRRTLRCILRSSTGTTGGPCRTHEAQKSRYTQFAAQVGWATAGRQLARRHRLVRSSAWAAGTATQAAARAISCWPTAGTGKWGPVQARSTSGIGQARLRQPDQVECCRLKSVFAASTPSAGRG